MDLGNITCEPFLACKSQALHCLIRSAHYPALSLFMLDSKVFEDTNDEQEFPYNTGFTAFSIYPAPEPYLQPPPAGYVPPTQRAGVNAAITEFYGEASVQFPAWLSTP